MSDTNFWLFPVVMVSATRTHMTGRQQLIQRLTRCSGIFIASLGLALALARRPVNG